MVKFNILFVVTGLLIVTSSCSKFLEESSQSEIVPRSAESLNEFLLGDGYPDGFHPFERYMNDDVTMVVNYGSETETHVYTWQPDMIEKASGWGLPTWEMLYKRIQPCNTTLDYLPKMTGKQEFKDYVAGQALLLRALYYLKLVNCYGLPYNDTQSDPKTNLGVPLLTHGGIEANYKSRNTVMEVYNQIEKDLIEGIRLLDGSGQVHSKYRIGSAAGHLLASRMYLDTEKWDEVIKHTDPILKGPYTLMDLRTWGNVDPLNKPVISMENPETIWAFKGKGDITSNDTSYYNLSNDLTSSYISGDLRQGIYWSKGIIRKLSQADMGAKPSQVFRLSEAYLNRAEAFAQLYRKGNTEAGQQCINLLNALREKRFAADKYIPFKLPASTDQLLQMVREERRRELVNEGFRWFDLRRYGMPRIEHKFIVTPSLVQKYVLEARDPSYLFPIPEKAILLNPKIVQNPLAPIRKLQQ